MTDEHSLWLAVVLHDIGKFEAPTPQQGGKGKRETLLRSVFSRVKGANTALYHPLRSLQLERQALFPQPEQVVPSPPYARVWEQFTEDLQKVPVPHLRSLQALLFKHFGAAPSDRSYDNIPDISLYYHMVTI